MVLYYGLLALETANNTIAATAAAATSTASIPRITSDRTSLSRKQKYLSNSIGKMPSSSTSTSSSNSWIYTEDLKKRFEERYIDYRYVFVPVYIDPKSTRRNHSTIAIASHRIDRENSWIYSRSLRDHLFHSTSKISLPLTTNISSSACCVTNHGFMRDELPIKKDLKTRLFKRSSSVKEKSTTNISLSSLPFHPFMSSTSSSFSAITNNLGKYQTNMVVEEDDEGGDDENHFAPLIKHDSTIPSSLSTSRSMGVPLTDNNTIVNSTDTNETTFSTSKSSNTKTSIKHSTSHTNKLTRLRSFFFRTSPFSSSFSRTQQQQQQQQTTLSTPSLSNRIPTT
ncbi:unnamed protein product [Adineta steineri]|uniref:Uncharacterized protein n=1 Tax=Adineta steineri TaxID=433720 RepID=A0A819E9A8_9BILA|nr:unnamed protein product [Adineta steineri]CAF3846820.1 unnamed protein product [Adineta steineri]